MKHLKRLAALAIAAVLLPWHQAKAAPLEENVPVTVSSPAVILAEVSTGTVIFEKNADQRREVASITKLMTALLAFEALESGRLALGDMVTVSKTAAAMQGSQALLDAGASYSVEELLKTTVMASANDSAVALAEHIAGSEEAFVTMMNERAKTLGMDDTHYVNCTGYPKEGQYTTARDVLTLCCEVALHPAYHSYASIWIDKLTHPGGRVTDLTNTNRLVRFYDGCDGFKTGSTDAAKYCLAATAEKNGMRLVAIVLGTPTSQKRFDEARAMLDYGFANYHRITVADKGEMLGKTIPVRGGSAEEVGVTLANGLSMLLKKGQEKQLHMELSLPDSVQAPVMQGDVVGTAHVLLGERVIARLNCIAASDVPRPGFIEGLYRILDAWR